MNQPQKVTAQEEKIPVEMAELEKAISEIALPQRSKIRDAFQKVKDSTQRRRRILLLVQEALSQLRLDMKYLMFDLEATRRERDDYREQLEQS